MWKIILFSSIFFDIYYLFGQVAGMDTTVIFSANKQYKISVTGLEYEGFAGDQKLLPIQVAHNDTLWIKNYSSS